MEEMNALGQLLIARIVLRYIPQAFKQREFNKRVDKLAGTQIELN